MERAIKGEIKSERLRESIRYRSRSRKFLYITLLILFVIMTGQTGATIAAELEKRAYWPK